MQDSIPVEVNISDILNDDQFRISRNNYPASLSLSLKLSGMLEIPWLIKQGSGYIIFTCHNRIRILQETGVNLLKCNILVEPDADIFMKYVSLKSYRNELGPAGKLKSLLLLKDKFRIDDKALSEFCKKILKLPEEVIRDNKFTGNFFLFHNSLINYLDEKDIGFKTIRDLINLPADWLGVISRWTENIQIRVNLFKIIVENIFDIYRRGDHISAVKSIHIYEDKTLHDEIFKVRYPEYMKMKIESDAIIRELDVPGITIDFPENFNRNSVTIKLIISKNSDCRSQLKKISAIDPDKLNELVSLL